MSKQKDIKMMPPDSARIGRNPLFIYNSLSSVWRWVFDKLRQRQTECFDNASAHL